MDRALPRSHFLKFALRGKGPRTLGVDFLDHNLLWSLKVHINTFLMRGKTLFGAHLKLVIELLKHGSFLGKLHILASFNNIKQRQDSEFSNF